MNGQSILNLLGLPNSFGGLLLMLGLIMTLAPYAAGKDFGAFKVPDFGIRINNRLRVIGPIALLFFILLFTPLIPLDNSSTISAKNPFGEVQILLDGREITLTAETLESPSSLDHITHVKYGFQLERPKDINKFHYETLSAMEYAKKLGRADGGFFSISAAINFNPVLRDSFVFRIYIGEPFKVKFRENSSLGPKYTNEELEALAKSVKKSDEEINQFLTALQEFGKKLTQTLQKDVSINFFNEISIVVADRKQLELNIAQSQASRKVHQNAIPLIYLLSYGGILPPFDISSTQNIAVSGDNRIIGFFAKREFRDVIINDTNVDKAFNYTYRFYVVSGDYIYQITLNYMQHTEVPREIWEELVEILKSIRIVI